MLSLKELDINNQQQYIIFGAGKAGRALYNYMTCQGVDTIYCDNNEALQDANKKIYSVKDASKISNGIFLLAFYGNNQTKIESAKCSLISCGVNAEHMIELDINEILDYLFVKKVEEIRRKQNNPELIKRVDEIVFLAMDHTKDSAQQVGGGPIGALMMQKKFLSNLPELTIDFPYYNYEAIEYYGSASWMIKPIIAANSIALSRKNAIFVANDVFSAYGVLLAGSKCAWIHHAQGDFLREFDSWGANVSQAVLDEILKIEKYVMENAYQVRFPSNGARKYYIESFAENVFFNSGAPLYNTIRDYKDTESVGDIQKDEHSITFLSVGQMTELKGMDQIPEFLQEYAKKSNKKIRWIVVADGVLKEKVRESMHQVILENPNIEFLNIDYKISHAQIYHLMEISDVYLMLHRVSIFDFSTLEAMYMAKAIILSNIPGNDEFNQSNNICLVDEDVPWETVLRYIDNRDDNGAKNKLVYDTYFSADPFISRYTDFIHEFIKGAIS